MKSKNYCFSISKLYLLFAVLVCTVFLGVKPVRVEAKKTDAMWAVYKVKETSTYTKYSSYFLNPTYIYTPSYKLYSSKGYKYKTGLDLSSSKYKSSTYSDTTGFARSASDLKKSKSKGKDTQKYTNYVEITVPLNYSDSSKDEFGGGYLEFNTPNWHASSVNWKVSGDKNCIKLRLCDDCLSKGEYEVADKEVRNSDGSATYRVRYYIKGKGSATVTATYGGKKYVCKINVVDSTKKLSKSGFTHKMIYFQLTSYFMCNDEVIFKNPMSSLAECVNGSVAKSIFNYFPSATYEDIVWSIDDTSVIRFFYETDTFWTKWSKSKKSTYKCKTYWLQGTYKKDETKRYLPYIAVVGTGTTYLRATYGGKTYKIKVKVDRTYVRKGKNDLCWKCTYVD